MVDSKKVTDEIELYTIPKNFLDQVQRTPSMTALRWKDVNGSWQEMSYEHLSISISKVVTGLKNLGIKPGDCVVMMLRNRIEFHICDLALLFLRAVPVSIYNSSSVDQIVDLVNRVNPSVAIIEDCFSEKFTQAKKYISNSVSCVSVGETFDNSTQFEDFLTESPSDLLTLAGIVESTDLATIIFTSGTTGEPKGVVLDNANITWTVTSLRRRLSLEKYEGNSLISYLPMAHVAERMVSHYVSLLSGFKVTCCPDATDLLDYMTNTRSTIIFGVPRVYEKIYAKVRENLRGEAKDSQSKLSLKMMNVKENLKIKMLSSVIKKKIGIDKLVIAVSGGAPLSSQIHEWFRDLKVPLSEIYGLSETSGPVSWDPFKVKIGTVGRVIPGSELKLDESGEVIVKGGNVFRGYFKDPKATSEVLSLDGWFKTGDIGEIDKQGYLKIIDRKREILITSGGKNVSPTALENAIKLIPVVSQAMVVGNNRKFISALVSLDEQALLKWAQINNVDGDYSQLINNPVLLKKVTEDIAIVMDNFSSAEAVKKFRVVSEEWQPDSQFLTPTAKLKRKNIETYYSNLIDSMYQD